MVAAPRRATPASTSDDHGVRRVIRESVRNSQALLAFFALSNADIVVARNVLDDHDAGLYAGGLILTKAVLFLPQFVVVLAFPSMSTASERRRRTDRGASAWWPRSARSPPLGAWLLSGPGAGLRRRRGLRRDRRTSCGCSRSSAPCSSMLQLLVYSVLARQGSGPVYLVWAALVALVALGVDGRPRSTGCSPWSLTIDAGAAGRAAGVSL